MRYEWPGVRGARLTVLGAHRRRRLVLAAAVLTVLVVQPWAALAKPPPGIVASPGDLDKSFGGDGIVTTAVGHGLDADKAEGVLVQPNGRIVVAGWTNPGGPSGDQNFLVSRYLSNGNLDPSFGPGTGVVTVPVAPTAEPDEGQAITRQPDGKLVVAGSADMGATGFDFAVVRLNEDGSLDPSFGGDGKVTIPIGPGDALDRAFDVAIDGNDVVVAGKGTFRATFTDFAVVRLNADGSLDQGFDGDSGTGNGIVTIPVGPGDSSDSAEAVAIQPTPRPPQASQPPNIVLAGLTDNAVPSFDFAVVRLNFRGELDTAFGGDGIVTTSAGPKDDYAEDVLIQPNDGRIVAAGVAATVPGTAQVDFALVRYMPDGTLDSSFGGDGIVITHFVDGTPSTVGTSLASYAHAIVRQPNGRLVAGGFATRLDKFDNNYALARYRPNGSLDTSFGTSGTAVTPIAPGGGADEAMGLALQSDDKIVAAGYSDPFPGTGQDISLARYHGRHVYTCFGTTPNDC